MATIEAMQVLVDTNVIVDITGDSNEWLTWSISQMEKHVGCLLINPIIYAELCIPLDSADEVDRLVAVFGLEYLELPKAALFLAARAFRRYRQCGGTKSAPLPDFFIGAHAAALEIPILTRDVGRYATYFPEVTLITP